MNRGRSIGLAIVGCGKIGRIRAEFARKNAAVEWIGLCDIDRKVGEKLSEDIQADFFTQDYKELLSRSEVDAVVISTFASERMGPVLGAIEHGHSLFIEKPLATSPDESEKLVCAIEDAKIDAVLGYSQRFRRRFMETKNRIASGQMGDVTSVVVRAFLNSFNPRVNSLKSEFPHRLTPMVISGTHSMDLCQWFLSEKKPVEVYAKSNVGELEEFGTKDSTFSIVTYDDGSMLSMSVCWSLAKVWPGEVYTMDIGIVGTEGVLTIDDSHRDLVLATEKPHPTHRPGEGKHVSFLGSYPPGDYVFDQLWGPMREETKSWHDRICLGEETPHTTASEGHENLLLCLAMDLSAKIQEPVKLPVSVEELSKHLK